VSCLSARLLSFLSSEFGVVGVFLYSIHFFPASTSHHIGHNFLPSSHARHQFSSISHTRRESSIHMPTRPSRLSSLLAPPPLLITEVVVVELVVRWFSFEGVFVAFFLFSFICLFIVVFLISSLFSCFLFVFFLTFQLDFLSPPQDRHLRIHDSL